MTAGVSPHLDAAANDARPPRTEVDSSASRQNGLPGTGDALVREQALALVLVGECLDRASLRDAATAVVTELASALRCSRVSLGLVRDERVELVALSNSAEFERRSNLVRTIEDAMQEACDAGAVLRYPDPDPRVNAQAHTELSRVTSDGTILTIPIVSNALLGALLFETPAGEPLERSTERFLGRLAWLIAPLLELKQRLEQPLIGRLRSALRNLLTNVLGASYLRAKLLGAGIVALVLLTSLMDGTARVTSGAALEPSESHAVVAPVQGYIAEAFHRAGDVVEAGAPLAALDLRDLELERTRWESELGKLGREYGAALATRDRNKQRVLRSQQRQVNSQLALIDNLMQRSQLTAPVAGVVVNGDLSDAFGSPVERGQLLFEIAPLDSYRLILNVDERDIAEVSEGQTGRLLLAGRPETPIRFVVRRIMPVSRPEDGRNVFRVEAELSEKVDWLRPGMAGTAKVDVGERSLAWIYTHHLISAIRLRLWKLGL
jgi:multidrug resistance efflux pump